MLEKPDLPDSLIIDRLAVHYALTTAHLAFLPLGADFNTAVYRVEDAAGTAFFLKLRRGPFDVNTVTVPSFLKSTGIDEVIAPLKTRNGSLWTHLHEYTMTLFPFIEGQDGYEVNLTPAQWLQFGRVLRQLHDAQPPAAIEQHLPREMFDPRLRDQVRAYQARVETADFAEPSAARLAVFMREHRARISGLVERAGQLAGELQEQAHNHVVLCHGDIHAGNLHLTPGGDLYLVDWDTLLMAPKEKDLAMIGGSAVWKDAAQERIFYEGYGPVQVNRPALAYYRFERIIADIAAYCEQLLDSNEGGEDREQSLKYFASNFLPGREIDLAYLTLL